MKNFVVFFLGLSILVMSACTKKADTEAALTAIGEASRQIVAALDSDDVEAILAGLSADHITMAPNEPAFMDMAMLRSWHEARVDQFTMDFGFSSQEIHVASDWAFERWTATVILTPKAGGNPVPDGAWKLVRAIWNSDNPIQTAQ